MDFKNNDCDRVNGKQKVWIHTDAEGGNISITSPNSNTAEMDMYNDDTFRIYFTKVGVGYCGDIITSINKNINLNVVPDLATITSITCTKRSSYVSAFNVKGIRFYKFCFLTGEMQFSSHGNLTGHIAFNVSAVPNNTFETCGTAYGMTAGANVKTLANSGDIYVDIPSTMTVLRFTLPYICK